MNTHQYHTAAGRVRIKIKVKRSLFIGSLSPASDRATAEQFIAEIKSEFHDATHNCYAYRIDADTFRYYDDGEPANTAGKPILAMIDKYHLRESVLVVTRYFGGVKLGVGGLIQAYSTCAEETIRQADIIPLIHYRQFTVEYPYKLTRQVQYVVSSVEGKVTDSHFGETVTSQVKIPETSVEAFRKKLLTGKNEIKILEMK